MHKFLDSIYRRSLYSRLPNTPYAGRSLAANHLTCCRSRMRHDGVLGTEAEAHVGGNGNVHHPGVGQVEPAHQLRVFLYRLDLQAWVVALLLADGGDRVALVVVGGIDERLLGQ